MHYTMEELLVRCHQLLELELNQKMSNNNRTMCEYNWFMQLKL